MAVRGPRELRPAATLPRAPMLRAFLKSRIAASPAGSATLCSRGGRANETVAALPLSALSTRVSHVYEGTLRAPLSPSPTHTHSRGRAASVSPWGALCTAWLAVSGALTCWVFLHAGVPGERHQAAQLLQSPRHGACRWVSSTPSPRPSRTERRNHRPSGDRGGAGAFETDDMTGRVASRAAARS